MFLSELNDEIPMLNGYTLVYLKLGLDFLLKNGTFAFSPNRPCSKNWDFHRNSLRIRVPILGKLVLFVLTGDPLPKTIDMHKNLPE